jgi:hypothetical protein
MLIDSYRKTDTLAWLLRTKALQELFDLALAQGDDKIVLKLWNVAKEIDGLAENGTGNTAQRLGWYFGENGPLDKPLGVEPTVCNWLIDTTKCLNVGVFCCSSDAVEKVIELVKEDEASQRLLALKLQREIAERGINALELYHGWHGRYQEEGNDEGISDIAVMEPKLADNRNQLIKKYSKPSESALTGELQDTVKDVKTFIEVTTFYLRTVATWNLSRSIKNNPDNTALKNLVERLNASQDSSVAEKSLLTIIYNSLKKPSRGLVPTAPGNEPFRKERWEGLLNVYLEFGMHRDDKDVPPWYNIALGDNS